MEMSRTVLAIDLGGTKIQTALVDEAGGVVARDYRETLAAAGPRVVVDRILEAARMVMAEAERGLDAIAAVGVGSPGPLDVAEGVVIAPPNLPGWERVPLRDWIRDGLGIETYLENDANAAALGEHRFGAGQGVSNLIYVTVSTGIGGGLILDGRLFHGTTCSAGEIGHTTILPGGPLCGCGNRGCLEALASGTAIAREARLSVQRGVSTGMSALCAGDPESITARLVAEAANQGDAEACRIFDQAMNYLGLGMANMVNLFNPELIVIGGGVSNVGERMLGPLRRAIVRHALPPAAAAVSVALSQLRADVGVLGAAAVALMALEAQG